MLQRDLIEFHCLCTKVKSGCPQIQPVSSSAFAVPCPREPECCLPGAGSVSVGAVFWGLFAVIHEAMGIYVALDRSSGCAGLAELWAATHTVSASAQAKLDQLYKPKQNSEVAKNIESTDDLRNTPSPLMRW